MQALGTDKLGAADCGLVWSRLQSDIGLVPTSASCTPCVPLRLREALLLSSSPRPRAAACPHYASAELVAGQERSIPNPSEVEKSTKASGDLLRRFKEMKQSLTNELQEAPVLTDDEVALRVR